MQSPNIMFKLIRSIGLFMFFCAVLFSCQHAEGDKSGYEENKSDQTPRSLENAPKRSHDHQHDNGLQHHHRHQGHQNSKNRE